MRFSSPPATEADTTALAALATHEADTTAIHGISNTVPLDQICDLSPSNDDFLQLKSSAWANRTLAQVRTDLYAAVIGAGIDGTAAAPFYTRAADLDTGLYFSGTNQVALTAGGVRQLWANTSSVSITGNAVISGRLSLGQKSIGTTLNLATSDPGFLYVTAATCTINLFAVGWGGATASIFFILDPNDLLGTLTINAYDDGNGAFNDINGIDAVYGAWNDSFNALTGPFGPAATLTDTGSIWQLVYARTDTGSGAVGGWVIRKLATDAIY